MSENAKTIAWIIAIIILLILSNYLAGAFILHSQEQSLNAVSFLTYYDYWSWYHNEPAMKKSLKGSAMGGVVFGFILPIIIFIMANEKKRRLFGDAKFATLQEIKKAGLLEDGSSSKPGILLGKFSGYFIVLRSTLFALLAAPTRSGKGVSTVIPNLLLWAHSVVCMDIKKENWRITSRYRRRYGQVCHLFDPFTETEETSRYNPFTYVRDGDFRIGDLISIGEVFYPSHGGNDSFWDDQARNLFVGLSLYVAETPHLPFTIGEVLRQSSGKGKSIKEYLTDIINERNYRETEDINKETGELEKVLKPILDWDGEGLPPLSMECVDMLNRFLNTSDNTRSSILSSFNAPLLIWSNPIVDAATSASDFNLRDIRKKRMSIYIGINPNKISEAGRLVNLFFSQLINVNLDKLPEQDPTIKYQTLLLLDEMTAMGTIKILDKANAYIAGYWLRLLIIIQNSAQVEAEPPRGYGREGARTLLSNLAAKVIFATNSTEDSEDISKMLGTQTVKNTSVSRQIGGKQIGGKSESNSDHSRALLLPQEIREIGIDKEIIFVDNVKPIFCEKIFYYKENVFIDRLKEVSPSLAKLGRKLPTEQELKDAMMSGELSAPALKINLDAYKAKIQSRIGVLSESDIKDGVDLSRLAIDFSGLELKNENNPAPDDIENFVDSFFANLIEETPEEDAGDYEPEEPEIEDGGNYDGDDDLAEAEALLAVEDFTRLATETNLVYEDVSSIDEFSEYDHHESDDTGFNFVEELHEHYDIINAVYDESVEQVDVSVLYGDESHDENKKY
jgi:type IV secretion system protein VirD4